MNIYLFNNFLIESRHTERYFSFVKSAPYDLLMYVPICLKGHQKNIRKYPSLESCIADRDSCSSHH